MIKYHLHVYPEGYRTPFYIELKSKKAAKAAIEKHKGSKSLSLSKRYLWFNLYYDIPMKKVTK